MLSALCHDVDHPANNNDFEIASNSELSIMHNNFSVTNFY